METGLNIANLAEAVVQFYASSAQEQARLHTWLSRIQVSPQAWQFSWELMQLDKAQEVQFFGAITLHTKLMKYWHEVPPPSREELKLKILQTILLFASGPKLVLNRLCMSLSAYIVHMASEWPTAIEDVINTFQFQEISNGSKDMQIWIMLEVLQAIPEEINSLYTSVKRTSLRSEFSKKSTLVMDTIESYLTIQVAALHWGTADYNNVLQASQCVSSWVKNFGYNLEKCESISALLLKVVNICYWPCIKDTRRDGCLSGDENEVAESCLKALLCIIIQPDCHLYPKIASTLLKMFLDSLSEITKIEWTANNNNEDITSNIYVLYVSAIERHSHLLLSGMSTPNVESALLSSRLIQEILLCTDKPGIYPVEESCSSMAFGIWYLLQDEVFSIRDETARSKCWEYIRPLYAHVTRILVRKAEQPDENSLDRWSSDDLESFRCYRQDISDTFMYCYEVLHSDILNILLRILDEAVAELQVNFAKWTKLEACIYAFQSVAELFDGEESKQIAKLMQVLNELPYERVDKKLLGTALETVGAYCQWLKENPNYIPSAVELLVKGLNSPMSAQSTLGLKELCRECQIQMKPYGEPLLNACTMVLNSGHMKNADSVRLMFSIGKVLSLMPADKIPAYLDIVLSPCFEELSTICHELKKCSTSRMRTIFRLNMISTLFLSLNTDVCDFDQEVLKDGVETIQPILIVMQKTMPIFRRLAELWIDELDVLETACTALRHALVNLQSSFKPMLQDLCYFVLALLQNKCCAPTLDISHTAIMIFYKDDNCTTLMQQLLVECVMYTFQLFEDAMEKGFSNVVDTVDMLYSCLANLVRKLPQCLEPKEISYDRLFFYALKAMTLPENGPIRKSVQFISNFVLQSRNFPNMTEIVLERGEEILRTSWMCVACITPRQLVDKFADVFLSINKKYPAEMAAWFKNIMQNGLDLSNLQVNEMETNRFITQIIREKVNKRLLQQHLNEYAMKARGLSEKFQ